MSENIASTMPFAAAMGVEITQASKEKIIGTLTVRPDLCTAGHILHGGAIMAFADALGGIGAFFNLPEGAQGTATIESKTNFVSAAREGTTVTGTCEPLHVGKTTSVWQTHVNRGDGSLIAVITQTQLVR